MPKLRMELKRGSNRIREMLDEVKTLNKQKVEIGHFDEQGTHSNAGMGYVDLMRLHHRAHQARMENGATVNVPARPILDVAGARVKSVDGKFSIQSGLLAWGKLPITPMSNEKLLQDIGRGISNIEKDVFGVPSARIPMNSEYTVSLKGANTPMVDSTELVNAVSFKTSITKTLKQ